jgi:hypothetical protein
MMAGDRIAHRHLLSVDGLEAMPQSEQQRVLIIVSEQWASSNAGQLLTSCLINLLCRQVKVIRHIEVISTETPALIPLPNGHPARDFPACLETLAEWAVNGAVTVSTTPTGTTVDHTIFIGDASLEATPDRGHSLLLIGDGWRSWVGDPLEAPRLVLPTTSNPLGPFLAAALAAGEIFKRARGIRRGKFLSEAGYSLWSGTSSSDWDALEDGPQVIGSPLPPIHLIGTGAVGNAFAYIVANLGLGEAYLVLIDDDKYDDTNLNRCLLAGWSNLGHPKVDAISQTLRAGGVGVFPFVGAIKSYVTAARVGLRTDVARQVDDLTFAIVLSCVDKGTSRQDIQGLKPRLLLGGSTLDLQAKSNLYTGQLGAACLACFNPTERDGEKIRAVENQLRKMQQEERTRFLEVHGLDVPAVEEYLSGAKCGSLGETALQDFATHPSPEFSAGFVSLGAGLLLAAALLRKTLLSDAAPYCGDMTTLNFLNGGFADSGLGADDSCEQRCQDNF